MVAIIEIYGHIKSEEAEYLTVVPHIKNAPEFVTFQSLRRYCEDRSNTPSDFKEIRNTIPGAVINEEYLLHNVDDIIPPQYDANALLDDCRAVRTALDSLKPKYNDFTARCSFSGIGKSDPWLQPMLVLHT